jgi:hypothetical protein
MKTVVGVVVIIAGIAVIYYLTQNKGIITAFTQKEGADGTPDNKKTGTGKSSNEKTTDGTTTENPNNPVTNNPVTNNPNPNTPVTNPNNPPVVTPDYSNPIGLKYEGQTIYLTYKGTTIALSDKTRIGYLANGTLLTTANTEYRDGEYKARGVTTNPVGTTGYVDLSLQVGDLLVDNSMQKVYQKKVGTNLYDFYNAVGFLSDGTMVFKAIMNAGEETEYMYYYT